VGRAANCWPRVVALKRGYRLRQQNVRMAVELWKL
jgi:hypothetical protein